MLKKVGRLIRRCFVCPVMKTKPCLVYSLRPTERNSSSNVEIELERRRNAADERRKGSSRRRRMKQIMLRGDNVVSVYRAVEDGKFTTTSVDLEK